MVFIRPTIIRSSEDAGPLTRRKMELMRNEEYKKNGRGQTLLDQALEQIQVSPTGQ